MSNILVVDDDVEQRNVLEMFLKAKGHQVFSANDGKVAINIMGAEMIDLLITDILMPNMDGYELIMAIRKWPALPRIITVSGGSGKLDSEYLMETARRMKIDRDFTKPLNLATIEATISELLGTVDPE
jgi:CheY-like chemotaxis protein